MSSFRKHFKFILFQPQQRRYIEAKQIKHNKNIKRIKTKKLSNHSEGRKAANNWEDEGRFRKISQKR